MRFSKDFSSGIRLEITDRPSADVKDLLTATVYGAEGKLQYRHKNSSSRMDSFPEIRFITLRKSGRLLGTAALIPRITRLAQEKKLSCYIRYFSIPGSKKGRAGSGKDSRILRGSIKTTIQHLLQTTGQEISSEVDEVNSAPVFYAYVERENKQSQDFVELYGFEKIRAFNTFVLSRVLPVRYAAATPIKPEQHPEVLQRLDEAYKGYTFYSRDRIFDNGSYYVYTDHEKIVAGAKATLVEWEIVQIPGIMGFLIRNILPGIPLLSRLFNPKNMKFMAFEAVFSDKGAEGRLLQLMETICVDKGVNMGMIWADSKSPLAEACARMPLGLLQKLKPAIGADIYVRFSDQDEAVKKKYREYPAYISAADLV